MVTNLISELSSVVFTEAECEVTDGTDSFHRASHCHASIGIEDAAEVTWKADGRVLVT